MNKFILIFFFLFTINSIANQAKPRIVVTDANGKEVKIENGMGAKQIGMIWLAVKSDNEDVYKITNLSCILIRGTNQVANLSLTDEKIDLSSWRSQASPGDRIVISITRVVRIIDGKREEATELKGTTINIPLG